MLGVLGAQGEDAAATASLFTFLGKGPDSMDLGGGEGPKDTKDTTQGTKDKKRAGKGQQGQQGQQGQPGQEGSADI